MKLTSISKKTLKLWSEHSRFSYNKAIGFIKEETNYNKKNENFNWVLEYGAQNEKTDEYVGQNKKIFGSSCYYSKLDLRNLITPETVCSRIPWILKTPKHIRESGVFEAYKNFKSCLTNLGNKNIRKFNLGFKSKRDIKWSIEIPKESITYYKESKQISFYEARTTNERLKLTEQLNDSEIRHNCRVYFDGLNYFLCYQETKQIKDFKGSKWFASLDPGERKFNTMYCPDDSEYIMMGSGASKRMYNELLKLDNMLSNKNIKNKIICIKQREKIQNLQKEMHYKISKYLCENYQNIFIPKLTKDNNITKKIKNNGKKRTLKTDIVRKMVVLGHCKFVERLKTKAEEYKKVRINVITEEYTSQICLRCKTLTKTNKELFKCNKCSYEIDRDILGSTNILLKNW